MKTSRMAKRFCGGGIIFLGLVSLVIFPKPWLNMSQLSQPWLYAAQLSLAMYLSIGFGCIITGTLILRITRERLLSTFLGIALICSLAAAPVLVYATYIRTYAALVSEVPQDMVRVQLSRTRFLLERLRAGDTNRAIEILDAELTSDISRLKMVPVAERKSKTISVLERAEAYHAAHPWTGQVSIPE
jgi:hypothetical protein